jgi:hypothetical protein
LTLPAVARTIWAYKETCMSSKGRERTKELRQRRKRRKERLKQRVRDAKAGKS